VSLISMLHSDVQILQYKNQQGNHEKEAWKGSVDIVDCARTVSLLASREERIWGKSGLELYAELNAFLQ
jgi:hypothetical protein